MTINQPSNQIKLTNIAIVRIKKDKKRYELACYKNKLIEFRDGIENKQEEVLQIDRIFVNVNKGEYASKKDTTKSWPGLSDKEIIEDILKKGEFQVGEQERHAQSERIHNEVVNIVAGRLVDPNTKRVYTTGMIEKALDQLSALSSQQAEKSGIAAADEDSSTNSLPKWRGVTPNKPAKAQAQLAMNALIAHQLIPVMKARMRLRVSCPSAITKRAPESAKRDQPVKVATKGKKGKRVDEKAEETREEKAPCTVKETILGFFSETESQEIVGDEWETVGFVDPGEYNPLTKFIEAHTKGRARVEVLDMAVKHEDD